MTCSRPNDLVLVPFAGSGTECAMAVKDGRKFIGFEIEEKYAKMSNDRVQNILRQPSFLSVRSIAHNGFGLGEVPLLET